MKHDEEANPQDHSHYTLNALNEAQRRVLSTVRQPPWLILFWAIVAAIMTLLMFYPGPDSIRRFLAIGIFGLHFIGWIGWRHVLRNRGVVLRTFPRDLAGIMFGLCTAIFFIAVIITAAVFLDKGVQWAPWLAAGVNAIAIAFVTHRFPTGEWR